MKEPCAKTSARALFRPFALDSLRSRSAVQAGIIANSDSTNYQALRKRIVQHRCSLRKALMSIDYLHHAARRLDPQAASRIITELDRFAALLNQ